MNVTMQNALAYIWHCKYHYYMKKLVYIVMMIFWTNQVFSQNNAPSKELKEFVFEVPQMDLYKQLSDFKLQLKTIKGLEFAGFCESRKLLMIRMPQESLADFDALMDQRKQMYLVKENATIKLAEQACNAREEINYSKSLNH